MEKVRAIEELPPRSALDLLEAHPGDGVRRETVVLSIAIPLFLNVADIDRMLARAVKAVA